MFHKFILPLLAFFAVEAAFAQSSHITEKDYMRIATTIDSMKAWATAMQLDTITADTTERRADIQAALNIESEKIRLAANDSLSRAMRRILKIKGSFHYSLNDLPQLSVLVAPDNSFRMITWQVFVNPKEYKYMGFVQWENSRYVELKDKSPTMKSPLYSKLKSDNWYGALYYNMLSFKIKKKEYYLLFGYDADCFYNNRKIIEVFETNNVGHVSFGAPVFQLKDPAKEPKQPKTEAYYLKPPELHRLFIEYAKGTAVTVNYRPEEDMIMFDHVVPTVPTKYGLLNGPDGDVDGLKWQKDKWVLIERIYKDVMEEFPVPVPVLDKREDGVFGADKKRNKSATPIKP